MCLAWAWAWASAGHAATDDACAPKQEYDAIASAVTDRFYDRSFRGLNWSARVSHYRHKVPCNSGEAQVAATANALISELHASHTAVYTAKDMHYWGLNSLFSSNTNDYKVHFSGIWPELRDGRWFAKYVLEQSPAARAGIARGDELIRLNGNAFQPLGFGAGSSEVLLSSDGTNERTVSIQPVDEALVQAFVDASRASTRLITIDGKQVGYFHVWTARDAILESLNSALAMFEEKRVAGLIVDFRGGYGGTSPEYLWRLRDSAYLRKIPKVFLIDDSVRSGKELLAALIKKDKLGTLVGSRTAGAYLGAVPVRLLNDKYFVLVAAYAGTVPEFDSIEGVGIAPDVPVAPCKMHCSGRDPQLERATDWIRPRLQAQPN